MISNKHVAPKRKRGRILMTTTLKKFDEMRWMKDWIGFKFVRTNVRTDKRVQRKSLSEHPSNPTSREIGFNVQNLRTYNHFHNHFSIHVDPLKSLYF